MKIDNGKLLWRLVYFLCLSFFLFFVVIHLNNRVNNSDDFFFLQRLNDLGFWKSITEWKFNQRPVSHFVFNLTFFLNTKIETLKWSLLIGNLSMLLLLIHSLKLLISKLFSSINIQLEGKKNWAFATLIAMCYFFFCIERSEVWLWYICSTIYLLPIVFFNYGLFFLFGNKKNQFYSIFFFLLIGGTLELMIPIVGSLLLVFFINKKISVSTMLLNGCSLLFFSFFQFFSKGVENRLNLENMVSTEYSSTFASTFIHLFDKKNAFFILLVIIILALLQEFKSSLEKIEFRRIIQWIVILLVVYFIATWLISNMVFAGTFGVLRMWAPFSLFLMVFIILCALRMSLFIRWKMQIMGIFSIVIFAVLFGYFSSQQFNMAVEYAKEYDLIVAGKSDKIVSPDSGILISTGDFNLLKSNLISFGEKQTEFLEPN